MDSTAVPQVQPPGIIDTILKGGKASLRPFWKFLGVWAATHLPLIGLSFLSWLGTLLSKFEPVKGIGVFLCFVGSTLSFIIWAATLPGWFHIALQQARRQPYQFKELLQPTYSIFTCLLTCCGLIALFGVALLPGLFFLFTFFVAFKINLLTGIIGVVLSIPVFVLPSAFLLSKVLLAPFFVVDGDLGPIDAIKASWHATTGIWWRTSIVSAVWFSVQFILGPLIVGIFLWEMGLWTSLAIIYDNRKQLSKQSPYGPGCRR